MFEVTLHYRVGKENETITGINIPCDGPFNQYWVLDIGEEQHFCVNRAHVITIECAVPDAFIIPIEQIEAGSQMQQMQFEQQLQQMQQPSEGGSFG